MVVRSVVFAGVAAGALVASALVAGPALGATGHGGAPLPYPPKAVRVAATNATFAAIEAKIAAGKSMRLRVPDPTAQEDILDYGVNDLWKTGIDGAGRDGGVHRHQP